MFLRVKTCSLIYDGVSRESMFMACLQGLDAYDGNSNLIQGPNQCPVGLK